MKNFRTFFVALIFIVVAGSISAGYQPVRLEDLINNPDKYDQEIVSFQAEAIGEPLYTESGNWFNLTLDGYYLGVFFENISFIQNIRYWGSYAEKGDFVQVKGVFYKDCPLHSQPGVHLISLEVAERGKELKDLASLGKKNFAFLSLVICLTMALIYLIKVRWQKKSKN